MVNPKIIPQEKSKNIHPPKLIKLLSLVFFARPF